MTLAKLASLIFFISFVFCQKGQAADRPEVLQKAKQLMAKGDYKTAAEILRMELYKDDQAPATWFFLGKCYERLGVKKAAYQSYRTLVNGFPSAPEALEATKLMRALRTQRAPMSGTIKSVATPAAKTELNNRIYIVPPRFNHSSVSSSMVTLVREVIRNLPPNIYKILNEGDVNVYIMPNIMDKYPDAVSGVNPVTKQFMSLEDGRTYDTEVNIYERRALRGGSAELAEPNSPELIRSTVYILLAHALNACLEFPSRGEQYKRVYQQDKAAMSLTLRGKLHSFVVDEPVGTGETFANLAASIMGKIDMQDKDLNRGFPRCRAWIESRLESIMHKSDGH